ncbi:MAK10-like protein [Tanacetum coccineum]
MESLELGNNRSAFVQSKVSAKMEDPELFTLPCRLGDSKPFYSLADLGSCVNIILLYLFKNLNIRLLEETGHVFGLADGTKSYPIGIVKDVEVHIGKLKLLNDLYVIDMKKDPKTPLLLGRGFLATANAVIDYRMAKIAVEEGITRSVFSLKGVNLGEEEAPYWTTLGKRESYKPHPSSDRVGAQIPYYARKDFLDCHFPGEWEIARDADINPFKDVLVFRRMVEFLGAIPKNLKSNMWESEDLINNPINWNKPPKNGDGAWHSMIRLIDPDGEKFTKTLQSISTTRKLSERESPREIIDLDNFYET